MIAWGQRPKTPLLGEKTGRCGGWLLLTKKGIDVVAIRKCRKRVEVQNANKCNPLVGKQGLENKGKNPVRVRKGKKDEEENSYISMVWLHVPNWADSERGGGRYNGELNTSLNVVVERRGEGSNKRGQWSLVIQGEEKERTHPSILTPTQIMRIRPQRGRSRTERQRTGG